MGTAEKTNNMAIAAAFDKRDKRFIPATSWACN
jgi:hypothetical protein